MTSSCFITRDTWYDNVMARPSDHDWIRDLELGPWLLRLMLHTRCHNGNVSNIKLYIPQLKYYYCYTLCHNGNPIQMRNLTKFWICEIGFPVSLIWYLTGVWAAPVKKVWIKASWTHFEQHFPDTFLTHCLLSVKKVFKCVNVFKTCCPRCNNINVCIRCCV